jgi:hypothetical protein
MRNPHTGEFVSIFRQLIGHPVGLDAQHPVKVGPFEGIQFAAMLPQGEGQIVQIENPTGGILEIDGRAAAFDAIVATFQFTSVGSVLGPAAKTSVVGLPTKQDVVSKRLCAQVITYARENNKSECVAYPNPCEVPDGWQVCTGQ